jgi:apolipoprotein D and lipocalin family protein
MIAKILIFISLISAGLSASDWGQCQVTYKEGKEFHTKDYLGKWYEVARHNTIPFQKGECTTAEYSLNEAGNIAILNQEKLNDAYVGVKGEGFNTDDAFRFKITFELGFFSKYFKGDYRVINTDYKNYAIIYSCTDYFFGKFYYAWILSRTPELPQILLENALNELETNLGIRKDEFHFTEHSKDKCGEH